MFAFHAVNYIKAKYDADNAQGKVRIARVFFDNDAELVQKEFPTADLAVAIVDYRHAQTEYQRNQIAVEFMEKHMDELLKLFDQHFNGKCLD